MVYIFVVYSMGLYSVKFVVDSERHMCNTAAYRSKNRPFVPTPVSEIAIAGGDPLRIFRRVIPRQRVKSWGYQMVKKS